MASNSPIIYFTLNDKDARQPQQMTSESAGYDLFATETMTICEGEIKKINTKISLVLPKGFFGMIRDRSHMVTNNKMFVEAGIIDADYRGDIKIVMRNGSPSPYTIQKGNRIAQLIIMPCLNNATWMEESGLECLDDDNDMHMITRYKAKEAPVKPSLTGKNSNAGKAQRKIYEFMTHTILPPKKDDFQYRKINEMDVSYEYVIDKPKFKIYEELQSLLANLSTSERTKLIEEQTKLVMEQSEMEYRNTRGRGGFGSTGR